MNENVKSEKKFKFNLKLMRDIAVALSLSVVLVLGFWQIYNVKLEKDLHVLENSVVQKRYAYLCIDNEYNRKMRIYKRRNNDINVAFLKAFKPLFDNQVIFYLSNESVKGRAQEMIVLEEKIANKFFDKWPNFIRKEEFYCIRLRNPKQKTAQ